MQNNFQNKDGLHPQDLRNLLIFAVVSVVLWSLYEGYVLRPATEAMQQRAQIEQEIAEKRARGEIPQLPQTRSREEALAEGARLQIETPSLKGSLSLTGGRIDDIALRRYFQTLEEKKNVVLLSPRDTDFPRYLEYGWTSGDDTLRLPARDSVWQASGDAVLSPDNPVTLYWDNGEGLRFERDISVDEDYMFTVTQRVINNSGRAITAFPYSLISQSGLPPEGQATWILHEGPIGWIGDELVEKNYSDLEDKRQETIEAMQGWAGITEKYWLSALIPQQGVRAKYRFNYVPNALEPEKGKYQIDYLAQGAEVAPGESFETTSYAFVGAKEVLTLQGYEDSLGIPNFDMAVDFGWFWFMTKPFFYILHFFNEWVGNFGLAIIFLTIVIRMAVFPLTNTSYKSFAKMKNVAPQIAELRERYGDDRQALQKEIMELYQREGVNPMAGCFPILLQIPIFFALYKVLFVTIEMRHAPFFGWIEDLSVPDPTSIFNLFGLLPYGVPGFLQIGVWPCLMLVAMLIQKQLNPPPTDKLQRDIMNLFPFVITMIMARFAAGLVIYWAMSAIISIMQQMYIMHRMGVPIHLLGQSEGEKRAEEALDKSADVQPLSEMAEDQTEDALFDDGQPPPPEKKVSPPKPKKKKKKG